MEMTNNKLTDPWRVIGVLREFLSRDDNVLFALLFGSYAAGRQKKGSDIDLAVYFENPPAGLDLLGLVNTLSGVCSADIDLVVLNGASPFLRHQVMKYGVPLEVKDRVLYREFREKVISEYDDYKYISGMAAYD